jgi:transcription antitermination factor NusA-like protein
VCDTCLKSEVLCQGCKRKLEESKISQLDVEISRALYELVQQHRGLDEIDFRRALREGGLTTLVVERGGQSLLTGREEKLAQKLEKQLGMKIRVIETGTDIHEIARNILAPVKVLGVNVLFRKSGEDEHHVRIGRSDLMLLPAGVDVLQALLTKITDKNIKLVSE